VAAVVVLVAAVPLFQVGADRLADRYATASEQLVAEGGRAMVWGDTVAMAARFPVTGTGLGTFAEVYPRFRSPEVRSFYEHAHNDVLQFAAEGGAIGVFLLLCVLIPVVRRTIAGLGGAYGPIGVGIAAGMAALLLHSLIDFNFRIPSNAALAAILAGALLGLPTWHQRG
jgi:O-antigen ligase